MSDFSIRDLFENRRIRVTLLAMISIILVTLLWRWWMAPAVIEQPNLKYVQLLWTATSSRNPAYLAKVEEAVKQRAASGEMSPAALAEFESIIQQAQSGAWEQASKACYYLAQGQQNRWRPTESSTHDHETSEPH